VCHLAKVDDVSFVLVGALAAVAQGAPLTTHDAIPEQVNNPTRILEFRPARPR
jgi:hypothetical protein